MVQKTRVIHSLKLKNFLVNNGLEPLEEIDNPFRDGFNSWVFEDTEDFKRVMDIYFNENSKKKEKRKKRRISRF